jgi:hypothetical protein
LRADTPASSRASAPTSTRSPTSCRSASRPRARYTLGLRGLWDTVFLTYFVLLRHQPSRALQRHGHGADEHVNRQGQILRRPADSDQRVLVLLMALLFWLDLTGAHPGTHFWGGHYKLIGRDFHPFSCCSRSAAA